MSRLATVGLMAAALVWTAGCGGEKPAADAPAGAEPAAGAAVEMPPANVAAAEIEKNLANLSAEDKKLVLLLKECPVSGELLGSMGPPIKVTKDGKELFICCEHCRELADEKFDEYIAKVDAKVAAAK